MPEYSPRQSSQPTILPQKQELLLEFYKINWDEMCWRRNAGYRTVILGLGYCGILLAITSFNHGIPTPIRYCLAAVIALTTAFGAAYLASNYQKYMSAAGRMIQIEDHVGAFDEDFLGSLGALLPAKRREFSKVPLMANPVCIGSILALVAGGLATAVAILLM